MSLLKSKPQARDALFELVGRKRAKPETTLLASGFVLEEHKGDLFASFESAR